jgi:pimeloyl-ACP methyl ester carboxylesterase
VIRTLDVSGLSLALVDSGGVGRPVVFQHGLCGDHRQVDELLPHDPAIRRLTLECRGHGRSQMGDPDALSIRTFADDVAMCVDRERLGPAVVGGVSMGAAVALRLAVERPDLVAALILARPAWLVDAAPENMKPMACVGRLLQRYAVSRARTEFERSEVAASLVASADNLATLRSLFDRPSASITSALLIAISADGPRVTWTQVSAIAVPTLVVACDRDPIHPLSFAIEFARRIPGARLERITPKAVDRRLYARDFRNSVRCFINSLPA